MILAALTYLLSLGNLLFAPAVLGILLGSIHQFRPKQNNFQNDHEYLIKQVLKKRSESLINFVGSVEVVLPSNSAKARPQLGFANSPHELLPDSIFEVTDVTGEVLLTTLDKYGEYRSELNSLMHSFYFFDKSIMVVFYTTIVLFIFSLFHSYVALVAFFLSILLFMYAAYSIFKLSGIVKRVHDIKVSSDFI